MYSALLPMAIQISLPLGLKMYRLTRFSVTSLQARVNLSPKESMSRFQLNLDSSLRVLTSLRTCSRTRCSFNGADIKMNWALLLLIVVHSTWYVNP